MSSPTLKMVQIECTNACNYECRHCYVDAKPGKSAEIPIHRLKSLVVELTSMGVRRVAVSGGESLMYPYLFDLLACLKAANIKVIVDTNGSLLDHGIAGRFHELKIDFVNVSLHGYSPETHDWLTQLPGSYYDAINALDVLAEMDVPHGISSTINRHNWHEIHKMVYIALALGAVKLSLFRFLRIGRGASNPSDLDITPAEHRAVFVNVAAVVAELECKAEFSCEAPYVFWDKGERFSPCKAGRDVCVVLANGDVIPCTGLRASEFVCGNVHDNPLERIWRDAPVLQRLRGFHRNPHLEVHGFCKDCKYLTICRGGGMSSLCICQRGRHKRE